MKPNTRQTEPSDYYVAGWEDGFDGVQADSEDPEYMLGYLHGLAEATS